MRHAGGREANLGIAETLTRLAEHCVVIHGDTIEAHLAVTADGASVDRARVLADC